jgi:hypothetical protein
VKRMAGEHEQALPQEPAAAVAEQFDRFEDQQQGGCVTAEAVRWTRLATCAVRCRCGRGEPSPGADVAGASPVPVQMWQRRAQSVLRSRNSRWLLVNFGRCILPAGRCRGARPVPVGGRLRLPLCRRKQSPALT